ncbi:MAG: ferritin-like domain-containing protein [Polyangiaceae bacterium]
MLYARARLRYFAVLGLPALAAPVFACSSGTTTTGTTPTATATASETATVSVANDTTTGTETDTQTATETAAASGTTKSAPPVQSWVPEKDPRIKPGKLGAGPRPDLLPIPSCPKGLVCYPAPDSLGGAKAAPAPYASCGLVPPGNTEEELKSHGTFITFIDVLTAQERQTHKDACCYEWIHVCPGGRPLHGEGGEILAAPTPRSDWLVELGTLDLARIPAAHRALAADHFAREAAFEHASIAAFSRASLGLLGAGAPADLLSDTHAAAADEIEHARLMYALASALRGAAEGPSKLDVARQAPLPATLADLAVETFVDAALGEAVAALALREAASIAEDRVIARLLSRIAEDEERHAALAWRTVAWALREGGAPVREALSRAAAEIEREVRTPPFVPDAATADLHALGILGPTALAAVRARALREVVLPCAEALLHAPIQAETALTDATV